MPTGLQRWFGDKVNVVIALVALSAGIFVVVLNRNLWFYGDDFAFLGRRYFEFAAGNRLDAVMQPHNEHWAAIPVLLYLLLEKLVGLRSRLAFALPLAFVHGLTVIVIGRIMRRSRVQTPLVLAGLVGVAFLGPGSENLLWTFQIGFVGGIMLGLTQLLLVDHVGPVCHRDFVAALVGIAAIATQGTGLTGIGVVALLLIVRRRWKALFVSVAPACGAFVIWHFSFGQEVNRTSPTNQQRLEIPAYVWKGFSTAADGLLHAPGTYSVVVGVLLAGLAILRRSWRDYEVPIVMAVGAVLFYFLNGLNRVVYGVDQAGSSRYTYVGVVLLTPLFFVALNEIVASASKKTAIGLFLAAWLGLSGVTGLARAADIRTKSDRDRLGITLAALRVNADGQIDSGQLPSAALDPDLTLGRLERLEESGMLPTVQLRRIDLLNAAVALRVRIEPSNGTRVMSNYRVLALNNADSERINDACIAVNPISNPRIVLGTDSQANAFVISSRQGGNFTVSLEDSTTGQLSQSRSFGLSAGTEYEVTGWLENSRVTIDLSPDSPTTVCGLALD